MPHQCTNCSRAFADGSKEMLGGCPDCGGNKFQFLPGGAMEGDPGGHGDGGSERYGGGGNERSRPTANGALSSPGPQTPDDGSGDDIIEAPVEPVGEKSVGQEDEAQASARRSVVSADELPPAGANHGADGPPTAPAEEPERPDLTQLRKELNEQFESIKILQPGEYELNLMELYDRQEYIIALEEDGRYVIEVPDTWREAD